MPPVPTTKPRRAKYSVLKCTRCRSDKKLCKPKEDGTGCKRCFEKEYICSGLQRLDPLASSRRRARRVLPGIPDVQSQPPSYNQGNENTTSHKINSEDEQRTTTPQLPTLSTIGSEFLYLTRLPQQSNERTSSRIIEQPPQPEDLTHVEPEKHNTLKDTNPTLNHCSYDLTSPVAINQQASTVEKVPARDEPAADQSIRNTRLRLFERALCVGNLDGAKKLGEEIIDFMYNDLETARRLHCEGKLFHAESICRMVGSLLKKIDLLPELQEFIGQSFRVENESILSDIYIGLGRNDEALRHLLKLTKAATADDTCPCGCAIANVWEDHVKKRLAQIYSNDITGDNFFLGLPPKEIVMWTDPDEWSTDPGDRNKSTGILQTRIFLCPNDLRYRILEPLLREALGEGRLDIVRACAATVLRDLGHRVDLPSAYLVCELLLGFTKSNRVLKQKLYEILRQNLQNKNLIHALLEHGNSTGSESQGKKNVWKFLNFQLSILELKLGQDFDFYGPVTPQKTRSLCIAILQHDKPDFLAEILELGLWKGDLLARFDTWPNARVKNDVAEDSPENWLSSLMQDTQMETQSEIDLLELACLANREKIVRVFLSYLMEGSSLNSDGLKLRNHYNHTRILRFAAMGGYSEIIDMVLKYLARIDPASRDTHVLVCEIPDCGKPGFGGFGLTWMSESKKLQFGWTHLASELTSLHFAVIYGRRKATTYQWLIEHGVDPLAEDSNGRCALFYALLCGPSPEHTAIVNCLMDSVCGLEFWKYKSFSSRDVFGDWSVPGVGSLGLSDRDRLLRELKKFPTEMRSADKNLGHLFEVLKRDSEKEGEK